MSYGRLKLRQKRESNPYPYGAEAFLGPRLELETVDFKLGHYPMSYLVDTSNPQVQSSRVLPESNPQ